MTKYISPAHTFSFNGVTIAVFHANKGEGLPKHDHVYAHATVCHAGKCCVRKENVYLELQKESGAVVLRENEWHEIEALEDNTVFCNIFAENKEK
jgi:quercetin dioxygenase-like cupin family protein